MGVLCKCQNKEPDHKIGLIGWSNLKLMVHTRKSKNWKKNGKILFLKVDTLKTNGYEMLNLWLY